MLESSIVNFHNMSAQAKNAAISEISNIFAAYKDNEKNQGKTPKILLIFLKIFNEK